MGQSPLVWPELTQATKTRNVFFFFLFLLFFKHFEPMNQRTEPVQQSADSHTLKRNIVQELCESQGGRPGLSVLTSLLVSVDVKIYCTVLRHWSQLVPNMSHDI